jgi:hypothetical protein
MKKFTQISVVVLAAVFMTGPVFADSPFDPTVEYKSVGKITMNMNGKEMTMKMTEHRAKGKRRILTSGVFGVMIQRLDRGVLWILMSMNRTYIESHMENAKSFRIPLGWVVKAKSGSVRIERVGTVTVRGVRTTKYTMVADVQIDGADECIGGTLWLDRNRIVRKFDMSFGTGKGGRSWRLSYVASSVTVGSQPASLFELPAGYKKALLPSYK